MKPDDFDARVSLPDDHAFRYPAHEPAPHELGIPAGTTEPVRLRTASEIEQERIERKVLDVLSKEDRETVEYRRRQGRDDLIAIIDKIAPRSPRT